MPSPTDSERRKARDAALRTQDEVIADHLAQALRSGELASAPSYGKPGLVFDPSSKGAQAYSRLAQELIARVGAARSKAESA